MPARPAEHALHEGPAAAIRPASKFRRGEWWTSDCSIELTRAAPDDALIGRRRRQQHLQLRTLL